MLLFHGMSEKSVILHEEINSSQAVTVSVVGSARTHFAISVSLHVPLKKNFLWIWARRVRESGWSSGIACSWRSWRNWWRCGEGDTHRGWGCRCCLWCSRVSDLPSLSCRVSFSQKLSEGKGLEGLSLSECVFDTVRPPQREFSNLHTSLAFGLLE